MDREIRYRCAVCGAKYAYETKDCIMCGWKHDIRQEIARDLDEGLNRISFNKYKRVYFVEHKDIHCDDDLMKMDETIPKLYFQNPLKYNVITDEKLERLIASQKVKKVEEPPYKCKACGRVVIEQEHEICEMCGWEDDCLQNNEPDYIGGANQMSLNQYKKFWEDCKNKILKFDGDKCFYAIDLARKYYTQHFKKKNEEYYRKINPHFDEDQKKFEENRLKNKEASEKIMSKIVENGKLVEQIQNKCKACGLGDIEHDFAICDFCGWEADDLQNDEPDYIGGANEMSLNQYKKFWEDCKDKILQHEGVKVFYAIDLARDYYEKNFKKQNEEYYRKINPHFDEDQKRFEENRLKNKEASKKVIE